MANKQQSKKIVEVERSNPVQQAIDTPVDRAFFSVVVTYHSSSQHLVSILQNLQSQLLPPKQIIIIDTSPNKSGLDIARRFRDGVNDIIVECAQVGIYEAWNRGIELAGNDDVLICNDDLLLPTNLTDIFTIAKMAQPALCYVPLTVSKEHYADSVTMPFNWLARIPETLGDFKLSNWMPGFCFYLTRKAIEEIGDFDTNFKVWFGDDDYETRLLEHGAKIGVPGIVQTSSCFVYHFGGKSYKYKSEEVQKLIKEDRDYFIKKHNLKKEDLLDVAE